MPQNICIRSVNVFDKYIHQLHVTVNTHTHTLQHDKCKYKKIGCVTSKRIRCEQNTKCKW
jgi:hypothetical protein